MIDVPFIRSIGIIVIAAAVFALGARVVALPSIVAYLAAGLLLGPLTGILEVSEAIHLIAETGIVLLLFLVGLELSFEKIKGAGFVAIAAGSAQIVLTVVGGFGLCFALGFARVPALFLGIALTFSSTVIVVKLLVDNQDSNRHFGQIAIGVLLVQDLFVVILLTLVSGLSGGGSFELAVIAGGLAKAFGGMALLLAAVLATSKWLLRVPFTWAARSPETLFIWSLCWCFLVVVATHFLHLSPEIGAFIAGVSLAQLPCRMFRASAEDRPGDREAAELEGHVIIVGMNALGRELAKRLGALGEEVLAIDVDPRKLERVPGRSLLGDAESPALLRDAALDKAKLLVSTLHIELTNDLLAYRCRRAGVPCSIHAVDLTALDALLEMDVKYLMVPKADGIKRQNRELKRLGFLPP